MKIEAKELIKALETLGIERSGNAINIIKTKDKMEFTAEKPFIITKRDKGKFLLIDPIEDKEIVIKANEIEKLIEEVERFLKIQINKNKIMRAILMYHRNDYEDKIREEIAKKIKKCIVVKVKREEAFMWATKEDEENYFKEKTERTFIIVEKKELFEFESMGINPDGKFVKYINKINEIKTKERIKNILGEKEIISIERIK